MYLTGISVTPAMHERMPITLRSPAWGPEPREAAKETLGIQGRQGAAGS